MHILFHLGHPAHYHLFKNSIKELKKNHKISILIKKKDILEDLLVEDGIKYVNILPDGRKDSKFGIFFGLLKSDFKIFFFSLKNKPDLLVGTSPNIAHVGKLLNIPSINVNEDDADVVPLYAKISYPFSTEIVTPIACDNGKWNNKSIKYNSYHELAYLHQNNFTPSKEKIKKLIDLDKPYFVLRFAKLTAHHDEGISGFSDRLAMDVIELLKAKGSVYITSERELLPQFEKYRLAVKLTDIHDVLYYSSMYIGDSQTMAAEAAVLGTPSIRFNDFVGKIGYLEELEKKYDLTIGIKTNEKEKLLNTIKKIINTENIKDNWAIKRDKMLAEKIDAAKFFTWFVENYPQSAKIMKENPEYQNKFK